MAAHRGAGRRERSPRALDCFPAAHPHAHRPPRVPNVGGNGRIRGARSVLSDGKGGSGCRLHAQGSRPYFGFAVARCRCVHPLAKAPSGGVQFRAGNSIQACVPAASSRRSHRPPCESATARTSARPRPAEPGRRDTKGRNKLAGFAPSPEPLSDTVTRTFEPVRAVWMLTPALGPPREA